MVKESMDSAADFPSCLSGTAVPMLALAPWQGVGAARDGAVFKTDVALGQNRNGIPFWGFRCTTYFSLF